MNKNYMIIVWVLTGLLYAWSAKAQIDPDCILKVHEATSQADIDLSVPNQMFGSAVELKNLNPVDIEDVNFIADQITLGNSTSKSSDELSYTSLVSYEEVLTSFDAADFFDFGKLKLNWSTDETYINIHTDFESYAILTRKIKNALEEADTIGCVSIEPAEPLSLIDEGLSPGTTFEYTAQAYVLDAYGKLYAFSPVNTTEGRTMAYDLTSANPHGTRSGYVNSDGQIDLTWQVDANCLQGDEGEPVFFEVRDATQDKQLFKRIIDDPSEYLKLGTFFNDYQLNFVLNNSYIRLDEMKVLDGYNWTLEFWFKVDEAPANPGDGRILFRNSNAKNRLIQNFTDGKMNFYYQYIDPDGELIVLNEVSTNQEVGEWVHVAVTSSFSSSNVYVNGSRIIHTNSGMDFDIHQLNNSGSNRSMIGAMAEVRLWATTRSAEQIKYNYLFGFQGDEQGLFSYYKLNEGPGQSGVLDEVSGTYHGTIVNANWSEFIEPTEDNEAFEFSKLIYVDQEDERTFELNIFEIGTGDEVCPEVTHTVSSDTVDRSAVVTATSDDPGKITVSWPSLTSDWADGYYVYRRKAFTAGEQWLRVSYLEADQPLVFKDVFSMEGPNSIEIGEAYEYKVAVSNNQYGLTELWARPIGTTFDYANTELMNVNDTIVFSWPDLSGIADGYDTLKVTRDGELVRLLINTKDTSVIDAFPVYGKDHIYGLTFVKNDLDYATIYDTIRVEVNGEIKGRVLTQTDDFPLEGVKVTLSGTVDGVLVMTTAMTDSLGFYSFRDVYYGEQTEFVLSATYEGHSFVGEESNDVREVTLNRYNRVAEAQDFHSLFEFQYINASFFDVHDLKAVPGLTDTRALAISWDRQIVHSGEFDVYFNVYRDTTLLGIVAERAMSTMVGSSNFYDSLVNPGNLHDYTVIAYTFLSSDKVLMDSLTAMLNYNQFIPNNINSLAAEVNADVGTIELTWGNSNPDQAQGYIVERGESGVFTPLDTLFGAYIYQYVDYSGQPGLSYGYRLSAFVQNDGENLVVSTATGATTDIIYPALPVFSVSQSTTTGNSLTFDLSLTLPVRIEERNFDGILFTRGDDTVGIIQKEFLSLTSETSGFQYSGTLLDNQGIVGDHNYQIVTYKLTDSKTYKSANATQLSSPVSYPVYGANISKSVGLWQPQKRVVRLTIPHRTDISYDSIAIDRTFNYSSSGYRWTEIAVIPVGEYEYYDVMPGYMDDIYRIRHRYRMFSNKKGGGRSYINVINGGKYTQRNYTHVDMPLQNPENVTASSNYGEYVEVSWEYPEYLHVEFEVYRNNALLATLDKAYLSYKDYTAEPGRTYSYSVKAKMDGKESEVIPTTGSVLSNYFVHGFAYDHHEKPLEDVVVRLYCYNSSNDVIHMVKSVTDTSGHYEFTRVPHRSDVVSMKMTAFKNGHTFLDQAVSVSDEDYLQEIDFKDQMVKPITSYGQTNVSEIIMVSAYTDEVNDRVQINWLPDNDNYNGFYILRDGNAIQDVTIWGDEFLAYDRTGDPGKSYTYSVRAYWDAPTVQSETQSLSEERKAPYLTLFPGYSEIQHLTAVSRDDLNQMELYWSLMGSADYFEVYRSEKLIATIPVNEPHEFIDLTGLPGHKYNYAVRSYLEATDSYSEFASTSLFYPDLVIPSSFEATTNEVEGTVGLSWSYTGNSINGFGIFRNDIKIGEVNETTLAYVDTLGIPESWHNYKVRSFRKDIYHNYSDFAEDTAFFPILRKPSNIDFDEFNNMGLLTWEYSTGNVEGFKVIRIDGAETETLKKVPVDEFKELTAGVAKYEFLDQYGMPETEYRYEVTAYDTRGLSAREFHSDPAYVVEEYPNLGAFSSVKSTSAETYIDLEWVLSGDQIIDGYTMLIDDAIEIDLTSDIQGYTYHISDEECILGTSRPSHTFKIMPYRFLEAVKTYSDNSDYTWTNEKVLSCTGRNQYITDFSATRGDA